uniref:Lon N-terminal domain-containing protein n=1 Tax=Octactis speculum TaxID=3111310 RepID=A0A7S2H9J6_9STRA|mmetsp:Transcript_62684/g.86155  ORF Transcript_62684/g.86155 Transcript_62684/m.86155 type:complete len:176 (+) Transcript_62684:661-1188(+)
MMRRCMESGQHQFGMCMSTSHEYGTMLRILHFEQLEDGSSHLDTVGERRYRVLQWGSKDGYATAEVEWVLDDLGDLPCPPGAVATLREKASDLFETCPGFGNALTAQLGTVPLDDKDFVFWMLAMVANGTVGSQGVYDLLFTADRHPDRPRSPLVSHTERLRIALQYTGRLGLMG